MSYTNILKLVLIVSASYICFCEGYMRKFVYYVYFSETITITTTTTITTTINNDNYI